MRLYIKLAVSFGAVASLLIAPLTFAAVTPTTGDCSTSITIDNSNANDSFVVYLNADGNSLTNKIDSPDTFTLGDIIPDCSSTFSNGDTANFYIVNKISGAFSQCFAGASFGQCAGSYAQNWNGGAGYAFDYEAAAPPSGGGGAFASSTVQAYLGSAISDIGTFLWNILPEIAYLLIALISLYAGYELGTRYISGRKF